MKLSIVVPIYNVREYVAKCIESCIVQDVSKEDYEVVLVNDGTKDDSMSVVEQIDWRETQHQIIHQENQGLSAARNTGWHHAKGEYVWFVDSDDWIEANCLSALLPQLDGVDVVSVNSYFYEFDNRQERLNSTIVARNGRELTTQSFCVMVPLYIYRKAFFNRIGFAFKVGIHHEDSQFSPRALYLAESVKCYNQPLYHYYQRKGSITQSFSSKKIYDLLTIFSDLWTFGSTVVRKEDRKLWCRYNLSSSVAEALRLSQQTEDRVVKAYVKKYVNSHKECSYAFRVASKKNCRLLGWLSWLLCNNLYLAYGLLYRLRYK